ncbi:hypothetical protein BS78_04G220800 [Paspalum vaginatum]|nr:hypothetical protein BS78_04G220800 [Paspalum vaginatum]
MPEKPPPLRRGPTMAAGSWVRSLHCKSAAADDVAARVAVAPKRLHPRLPRAGCGSSGDALLNRVASSKPSASRPKPKPGTKPSPEPKKKTTKPAAVPPSPPPPGPLGPVPALTELPAGHSSRQVVEIIFLSSWSALPALPVVPQPPPTPGAPPTTTTTTTTFPGVVEMLFRVHNPARAVARFEDYRAAVRARAGGASRSAADGNEMMRFAPAPQYDDSCRCRSSPAAATTTGGEEEAPRVRTFDGSGGAHASVRWPATGRRAMFLCRVIAGRVAEAGTGAAGGGKERFDSVRAPKSGELVVFDRRAVLPCFLIIYRL